MSSLEHSPSFKNEKNNLLITSKFGSGIKINKKKNRNNCNRLGSNFLNEKQKLIFSADDDFLNEIKSVKINDRSILSLKCKYKKEFFDSQTNIVKDGIEQTNNKSFIAEQLSNSNRKKDITETTTLNDQQTPLQKKNINQIQINNSKKESQTILDDNFNNFIKKTDITEPPKQLENTIDQSISFVDQYGQNADGLYESRSPLCFPCDESKFFISRDSLESLNLRERQDAINCTHPFGIKIWKPSLYKKKRSVVKRAEEDIHDFANKYLNSKTNFCIQLTNLIWTITIGFFLFLVCILGALFVFIFSGFRLSSNLIPYVKLLIKLGKYLLNPFGKLVFLKEDKNYLFEDKFDGRSVFEFRRWRSQDEGDLLFAPPRRYSNQFDSYLLKNNNQKKSMYESINDVSKDSIFLDEEKLPNLESLLGLTSNKSRFCYTKFRLFGRGRWSFGRLIFYLYFYVTLQPSLYLVSLLCWMLVFVIPMAKIVSTICDHLRRHPLALEFEFEKSYFKKQHIIKNNFINRLIVLCTYRSCGLHYYKYTIDGTNIFFINLLFLVFFVIIDFFLFKEKLKWNFWITNSNFIFLICLLSIVPLAYFIGQAVASISAQSSMGVGAAINAFFSTVVEIFLYCVALNQSKNKLVEGSIIGSILAGVLLLPGLSMCGGAVKRKTQRYNPRSAGVSSTMLLFAMVIMFAPSLFYQLYGSYDFNCKSSNINVDKKTTGAGYSCRFIEPILQLDNLYYKIVRPFSLVVASALFIAYFCGLFFTLRTHASLIWVSNFHETTINKKENFLSSSIISINNNNKNSKVNVDTCLFQPENNDNFRDEKKTVNQINSINNISSFVSKPKLSSPKTKSQKINVITTTNNAVPEHDSVVGHNAPNWSRNKSIAILLLATLFYAIIAEILVNNVDAVLVNSSINPKFLGLTIFSLVPNTTEFLNAISFAINGNIALSMEIGSAYALQVVLLQIPSLVFYTVIKKFSAPEQLFSLVFPRWDIISTLFSIYLYIYIYAEGKSNYFKGVILILVYVVVLLGFWFNDAIQNINAFK